LLRDYEPTKVVDSYINKLPCAKLCQAQMEQGKKQTEASASKGKIPMVSGLISDQIQYGMFSNFDARDTQQKPGEKHYFDIENIGYE